MRVTLLAEGASEVGRAGGLGAAAGHRLAEDALGPVHVLLRRCLERARGLSPDALRFDAPQRVGRGRIARGSDLLHPQRLRRLLAYPSPERTPDLAVVLVDADGHTDRRPILLGARREASVPSVVCVAVQETEAWWLADHDALGRVLGVRVAPVEQPERLAPGEAKASLQRLLAQAARTDPLASRRELALGLDLDRVRQRCRAFEDLLQELRAEGA